LRRVGEQREKIPAFRLSRCAPQGGEIALHLQWRIHNDFRFRESIPECLLNFCVKTLRFRAQL
jgi:hypothetical protein